MACLQQLCYCGEKLKGRYTIAKHFHGLMRQVSALGDIVLVVDRVDHQPLQGSVSGCKRVVSCCSTRWQAQSSRGCHTIF